MEFIFTLAELPAVVQQFLQQLSGKKVIAFHGQMGAGKTTFISALCKASGVTDAASSPTFSIINQYKTADGQTIYHMDWYRLKDEEEALQAGVEEVLYSGHLCLVEWPERAAGLLPDDTLHVQLELMDEGNEGSPFCNPGIVHFNLCVLLPKAIRMSAAPATRFISMEEYLEKEEQALEKHEYYKGEIFAMAGASVKHNRIVRNTQTEIDSFLKNKPCEILPSDIRVHVEANTLFTYPDLSIYCDPIAPYQNRTDTAVNPTVIIEVLSPSTQDYDRNGKFLLYQDIPSLKEYILISLTQMLVEKYTRQPDKEWQLMEYRNADEEFTIASILFTTTIGTLYRSVDVQEQ